MRDLADMHRAVDDYLRTRRALGFKLKRDAHFLVDFIAYLQAANAGAITTDAAVAWATLPAGADPSWWGTRLSVVRSFARWLAAFEPDTEVPPADLLPVRSQRAEPYPYTDADITALMRAARGIPTPLCAATHETLIGLLAVTGMRIGEAIGLDRSDVDWAEGLMVVRQAKFDKSRELVLHPSTIEALGLYAALRDRHHSQPTTPAFFVSVPGTRLIYANVQRRFHRLAAQVGLQPRSVRCRPRIHDLRHRFAVNTLLHWYRDGADVAARLPQLSTYLGHVAPANTYWYLRAAPELLALAAQRLEAVGGPRR